VNTGIGTSNDILLPTGYTYDQGPGGYDTALVEEYKAALDGWSKHALAVKDIVAVLIQQLNESHKGSGGPGYAAVPAKKAASPPKAKKAKRARNS
jgi:hypothetical protein